jgi:hypothetical protein
MPSKGHPFKTKTMKKLFPIFFLFAACSTVHKTVTTQKKTVDSTAVTRTDTSYKSRQSTHTDNLQVKDVNVTVTYSTPADSALAVAKATPVDRTPIKKVTSKKIDDYAAIISDAVSSAGNAGNIASITIHIGSITDSTTHTVKVDTGSAHSAQSVKVKDQTADQTKVVSRTGLPWYVYVGGGLLGLILLVYIIYRIYKKIAL